MGEIFVALLNGCFLARCCQSWTLFFSAPEENNNLMLVSFYENVKQLPGLAVIPWTAG
jgi:hypothetical protein